MEETNNATTETSRLTRVAYIRTILDKKTTEELTENDRFNLNSWLCTWVGQNVPWDPWGSGRKNRTKPPPDLLHRYILGYSTGADSYILDWLLRNSEPKYARLSRSDFTVYLSATQMNDPNNKDLLQRFASTNVTIKKITNPSE
ncbi:hypothetical protein FPOAC1_007392 [Fusarium poae]|jgi:hypothetical protein|nr:hypothetical protein FPOAC1_007392 [Fusarium poae]KAG8668031.1 hypothetical protein FPOAC1_007392 [Fusarium poae]